MLNSNKINSIDIFTKCSFDKLVNLHLNNNQINAIDSLLCSSLGKKLEILNLRFNQIDNIQVISQNKYDNMKILDLKNNKIDKKKNKELIEQIKKNNTYKLLI